jgi:hypothetical protein
MGKGRNQLGCQMTCSRIVSGGPLAIRTLTSGGKRFMFCSHVIRYFLR